MTRVCFVLNNVGDYHAARLRHCSNVLARRGASLVAIQASERSAFYHHKQMRFKELMEGVEHHSLSQHGEQWSFKALWKALSEIRPTHVFTVGYSDKLSLASLAYAKVNRAQAFFLADSKADDQPRSLVREKIKSHVIARFDGALVAGEKHRSYFRGLGLQGPIETGYDVIDNAFFRERGLRIASKATLLRRLGSLPDRYVICVSRLVARKRIDLVLRLFAESGAPAMGVGLVLVGSGPNEESIVELIRTMGLTKMVYHFRDVKNSMMPLFYSQAEALILASDYDQWGLCVNEAMALAVPCIVTERCGVAGEIVIDELTGFVFRAGTIQTPAQNLHRLLRDDGLRSRMSAEAFKMIALWNLDRFSGAVVRLVANGEGY